MNENVSDSFHGYTLYIYIIQKNNFNMKRKIAVFFPIKLNKITKILHGVSSNVGMELFYTLIESHFINGAVL